MFFELETSQDNRDINNDLSDFSLENVGNSCN